jgi:hypothetical protein
MPDGFVPDAHSSLSWVRSHARKVTLSAVALALVTSVGGCADNAARTDLAGLRQAYLMLAARDEEKTRTISSLQQQQAELTNKLNAMQGRVSRICFTTTPGGEVVVPCSELKNQ